MKSLAFEVALSYLRAQSSRLVSSVSLLSIAGIGLGVAALVVGSETVKVLTHSKLPVLVYR